MIYSTEDLSIYDVVILGAGRAGLNAAMLLGRLGDRVLLLDDAALPSCLQKSDLDLLQRYEVKLEACQVTKIDRHANGRFSVMSSARIWFGRKLLLACGRAEGAPMLDDRAHDPDALFVAGADGYLVAFAVHTQLERERSTMTPAFHLAG